MQAGEGQRERETQNPKQAPGSALSAQSLTWGFVLTAQNLEPASDSVSPSLSAPPQLALCLSLSKINKH